MAMAVLTLAAALGCAHPAPLVPRTASSPEVRQLDAGRGTNAFVVMGARPILVDAGWGMPSSTEQLVRALRRIAVEPRDLALIVLTHGHGDHAGGAARLRELSGARVVAGAGDVAMLEAEVDPTLKALRRHGLTVVAIHQHMLGTTPPIIFLHYYGVGPTTQLAEGFRAALDQLGSVGKRSGSH